MSTKDESLPELPEPDGFAGRDYYHRADSWFAEGRQFQPSDRRWSEAQMLAYALQAIANEREACAKVCEVRDRRGTAGVLGQREPGGLKC